MRNSLFGGSAAVQSDGNRFDRGRRSGIVSERPVDQHGAPTTLNDTQRNASHERLKETAAAVRGHRRNRARMLLDFGDDGAGYVVRENESHLGAVTPRQFTEGTL